MGIHNGFGLGEHWTLWKPPTHVALAVPTGQLTRTFFFESVAVVLTSCVCALPVCRTQSRVRKANL